VYGTLAVPVYDVPLVAVAENVALEQVKAEILAIAISSTLHDWKTIIKVSNKPTTEIPPFFILVIL
jgi:hypothetical protein